MKQIRFNKDFEKQGNIDYVFSYNMMVLDYQSKGKSVEGLEWFKEFDGFSVYPYDKNDRQYGYAELQGWTIKPQWCIPYKYNPRRLSRRLRKIQRDRQRNKARMYVRYRPEC